ncbi:histone-lysine N-methyltransferase SETD1B-A [Salminus brasiliensis]|uniref:histone-lysine N-methyltransferase SETD1B-A n=1 Tax=Salminus brasiliensis TaxID=930266 RepID=UPI003B833F4F
MRESGEKEAQEDNAESPESGEERGPSWSSYRLVVDPVLKGGTEKLYRYDGQCFSSPNPGVPPLEHVRDPRLARFWTKFKETDLPVPKFKIDENYVGPPKEVTFARLNDNIKDAFLGEMCKKFGEIQEVEVLYNPKNKKHLGIAKVIYDSVRGANEAVQKLHNTSVMGNNIHVELDPKGEKRMRYFQLLVSGLYTPFTLPLGEEAWGPLSPSYSSDSHSEYEAVKRLTHGLLSSSLSLSSGLLSSTPFDASTPLSMDTAYSSMHQDTPSSFWQTPLYQDTPYTSPLSHSNPGTPPQCEGLPNLSQVTDLQGHGSSSSKMISNMTPLLSSASQPAHPSPHLVQLTPHSKPNSRQGALISIIQSSRFSKGHMASGCQPHPVGRASRGGPRGHVWGPKYQNAYNRRPEHHYVHRPVFNRLKYRSGPASSLVPLPAHTQPDKLPIPPSQCEGGIDKPTGRLGQNTAREVPVNPSTGCVDKSTSAISQCISSAGAHPTQAEVALRSEPLGKALESPLMTPSTYLTFTSPPHVPDLEQEPSAGTQSPMQQCTSPGPGRSPPTGTPAPDAAPISLDSRIQMLLGTHGSDLPSNEDTSDSDTHSEDHSGTSKSYPNSPDPPDVTPFPTFPIDSAQKQEGSCGSGIEDVSPYPLPDSAEEGEVSSPGSTYQSKIPVISTHCSEIRSAPSQQTAMLKLFLRESEASEQPVEPRTCGGSSSPPPPIFRMPPPPVLLPPPGFPALPPPMMPPNLPALCGPPPLLPPANLSIPPPPFYPPPKLPMGQVGRPPRWNSPPAPLPIPTRITQGKTHPMYSPPFPIPPPPAAFPGVAVPQDGVRLRQCPPYPSVGGSAVVPGYRPPWPPPMLPVFDPSVPPPGYAPVNKSLHKATVDGVLAAVAAELRAIVKKDIHRRMVEGIAFAAFDQWWDEREHTAKIHVVPAKAGESKEAPKSRVLEPWKPVEGTGQEGTALGTGLGLGLRSALRLPSFKVKRKEPSVEDSVEAKRARPPSPELSEDGEAEEDTHLEDTVVDEPQKGADINMVKRRHARPLELDSDEEEEGEEEEKSEQIEGSECEKESSSQDSDHNTTQNKLCVADQDDEEEDEDDQREESLSGVQEDEDHSEDDKEVLSIASSCTPSESLSSSDQDYDSTVSSRSDFDSSEESLCSSELILVSSEDEDEEGAAERKVVEEIWISSDEEEADCEDVAHTVVHTPSPSSMISWEDELDPPVTPSAPLSSDGDLDHLLLGADPEEELRVRVFLHGYGCEDPVTQHLSNKLELPDPALLSSAEEQELQCPPSPSYKALSSDEELETPFETELEDLGDAMETLEEPGNLRPPTPTGSMSESDPDLELRHRLSPLHALEEELPHTPGGGIEMEDETPVLSPCPPTPLPPPPSPTGLHRFPSPPVNFSPPPLPSLYPAYEETPKTPGRNTKREHISRRMTTAQHSQDALLRMVMHGPFSPSITSPLPHAGNGVPRTPGRDISPSSPLSDHGDISFRHREQCYGQNPGWSSRYSPCSSGSSASETPSPVPNSPEFAQQQLNSSANRTTSLDVARLKRRRERLQHKRRMILLRKNRFSRNAEAVSRTPARNLISKSSGDVAACPNEGINGERTEAQSKRPLQGLENRVENRLEGRGMENPTLSEQLDQRTKRRWWTHISPCRPRFAPRSERREKLVLHAVWTRGVNVEEIGHLRASYERMLLQDSSCQWLSNTHWVPHPPSSVPEENPRVWREGVRYHITGSARTEGYYFISKRDKLRYLRHTHSATEETPQDTQCKNAQAQLPSSSRSGSDFRAEQRRLLSSFSCDSDLLKFNQLKFRKKKLRFSRSRIHDWGLFAEEPIAADEMVIEYVGQSIRQVIADMRERRYEQEGIGSSYLFRVDQDTIIDATKCGNLARFINHSCNPNCYAKVITVESKKKIVIYSRQPIGINEEITYDYKFPIEDEKIPCLCGAENCRGTLN